MTRCCKRLGFTLRGRVEEPLLVAAWRASSIVDAAVVLREVWMYGKPCLLECMRCDDRGAGERNGQREISHHCKAAPQQVTGTCAGFFSLPNSHNLQDYGRVSADRKR